MHRRPADYAFFKQHQPAVFKIMDGGPPDYEFARDNLPNSLILARDWALSEQKDDMAREPTNTGKRHAQEWNQHQQRLGFDKGKTLILGINEPHVWEAGIPEALRLYTIAMCDEATRLGLRVGAMQFSVGWPGNTGPDTPPNWAPWGGVEDAIKRNHGALVCHEYWANSGPGENWGWWAGRALKCPWNVPIVIGECGIDMYVKDGSVAHANRGWRGWVDANRYANELRYYTARMSADTRFVGCAVFAADFAAGEWYSFDLEPAYQAILATPEPIPPDPPIDPDPPTPPSNGVTSGSVTAEVGLNVRSAPNTMAPILGALAYGSTVLYDKTQSGWHHVIDGWVSGDWVGAIEDAQPQLPTGGALIWPCHGTVTTWFGVPPAAFSQPGHAGIDIAVPMHTPIRAVADGKVAAASSEQDYGQFVRVWHPHLRTYSFVAHLSEVRCSVGQMVKKGDVIALSGNSGFSTGPHTHLEFRAADANANYVTVTYGYLQGRYNPVIAYLVTGSPLAP